MVTDTAVTECTLGASDGSAPAQRPNRRRSRLDIALVCTVCAALVGASALVAVNERHVDTRFDQVQRSLDATRSQIALAGADLATVRSDLGTVDGQVNEDAAALAQDTAQLQSVESALTSARAHVSNQTSTIGDLTTCLGGVEQAQNALSVGDQTHAIDALDAVSSSCTSALAADA